MRGPRDGHIFGLCDTACGVLRINRHHDLAVTDALLGQRQFDDAFARMGIARDNGPIGLLRLTLGKGARQSRRRRWRLAQQQNARRVAVQTVNQTRTIHPLTPGRQKPVNMVQGLGAALNGKARGLVQGQDLVILIQDQRLGIGHIPVG